MLRLLILLLLLANAGYFAWSRGLLGEWGFAPLAQNEPQRLAQQIRPEALRLLRADEFRRIATLADAPARAGECLQAGPYDEAQAATLRAALEPLSLPAGSWSLQPTVQPGRWIIYMGKYADVEALAKKRAELRYRNVPFEDVRGSALEPGLSLGGFDSPGEAARQLEQLAERGVRTARVVQERPEIAGRLLLLPVVDETLRARLDDLKTQLSGKPLRACS